MSDVDLICPYCGFEEEHDFTDMSDQECKYDIHCSSCQKYFEVTNEWYRNVDVNGACDCCGMYQCKCSEVE